MDFNSICNSLHKNDKMKNTIFELIKPYLNILADKLTFYLIIFILFVLISFLLNLGVLIILIKYLNNINKIS